MNERLVREKGKRKKAKQPASSFFPFSFFLLSSLLCVYLLAGASGARAEEFELIKDAAGPASSAAAGDAEAAEQDASDAGDAEDGGPEPADATAKELRQLLEQHRLASPPESRKIAFSFSNVTLAAAGRELAQLAGVGVSVISDPKSPPPLAERRVSLTMTNVELTDALDWLMRQVDGVYTIGNTSICIASEPGQLDIDQVVRKVYPLRTMRRFDKPVTGPADLATEQAGIYQCVKTCLAEHLRQRPDATLAISPDRREFIAVCTPTGHRRIGEVLREIALNDLPPQPLPGTDPAASRSLTQELNAKLERIVQCRFNDRPVTKIISELAIQADVNIGLDPRELAGGEAMTMTLDAGKVPLKVALDAVAKRCALEGYSHELGRGLWLHGKRPCFHSARLPWDGWLIRSYPVEPILAKISLPRLMACVRESVTHGQWSGLIPAMAYAPSARLIVFHHTEAHREIEAYLRRLQKQVESGSLGTGTP